MNDLRVETDLAELRALYKDHLDSQRGSKWKNHALEVKAKVRRLEKWKNRALEAEAKVKRLEKCGLATTNIISGLRAEVVRLREDKPTAEEFERVCTANHKLEREVARMRQQFDARVTPEQLRARETGEITMPTQETHRRRISLRTSLHHAQTPECKQ